MAKEKIFFSTNQPKKEIFLYNIMMKMKKMKVKYLWGMHNDKHNPYLFANFYFTNKSSNNFFE